MLKLNVLAPSRIGEKILTKTKGTFMEKWVKYWQQVGKDYVEVALSLKRESKQKPLKAASYLGGLGFLALCAKYNPNLQSFQAKSVQCSNELGLVDSTLVRSDAVEHLKYIEKCFNTQRIRYQNLGIASIIWVDKASSECNVFENNCSYLKVPFWKFHEQIIDVGFLNTWWVISRRMLDYDVNY